MAEIVRPSKARSTILGRPTLYNDEVVEEICERLSLGESLRLICKSDGLPDLPTVMRWLRKGEHKDFEDKYAQARVAQQEVWIEEMRDLAKSIPERNPQTGGYDSAHVNHIRNQVMTMQWIASKLAPKRYGDVSKVTHEGNLGLSLRVFTGVPESEQLPKMIEGEISD